MQLLKFSQTTITPNECKQSHVDFVTLQTTCGTFQNKITVTPHRIPTAKKYKARSF